MKKITLRGFEYEIVKNYGNCFDYDELKEAVIENAKKIILEDVNNG